MYVSSTVVVIDSTVFLLKDHLASELRRSVRGLKVWAPDAFFLIIRKYVSKK